MKSPNLEIERYRILHHPVLGDMRGNIGTNDGCFKIPFNGNELTVITSDGDGWDHVSVSLKNRCPTWDEMKFVKEMFFRDDEAAIQIYPPKALYRNCHPYCLHWWRPQNVALPMPDPYMVAPDFS